MSVQEIYKARMRSHGESYAAGSYILASIILAFSGNGLHQLYDSLAGCIWLSADILILLLQFLNYGAKLRPILLFASTASGCLLLLMGSVIDELFVSRSVEAIIFSVFRLFANAGLFLGAVSGLLKEIGFEHKGYFASVYNRPGLVYLACNALFFFFSMYQFIDMPGTASFGYILVSICWLFASNAIRLKFDIKFDAKEASPLS